MAPRHRFGPAVLAAALLLPLTAGQGRADVVVVDFHTIVPMNPQTNIPTPYTENGFTITTISNGAPNIPLGMFGPADTGFTGGRTVFIQSGSPNTITLQPSGGGTFDLLSIDLSQFRPGPVLNGDVMFIGHRADGSTVAETFQLPFTAMGQPIVVGTFAFTGFTNLTSVNWDGGPGGTPFEHFHQFGNIVLQVGGAGTAVPEPSTLMLLAVGVPALLGCRQRRLPSPTRM
jgi:hypothetical protein